MDDSRKARHDTVRETSLSLLMRVRSADSQAWEQLVKLYSPLVYSWCRRGGIGEEDASDVLQEVFLTVSKALAGFRKDRPGDSFRGWLRVVTRNKIRDLQRQRGKQQIGKGGSIALGQLMQVPDDPLPDPTEPAVGEDDEKSLLYHRALELLRDGFEEKTWRAFWRAAVDGQAAPAVAEELGMTPGAVRQAKYKVLRRLNTELGELLE